MFIVIERSTDLDLVVFAVPLSKYMYKLSNIQCIFIYIERSTNIAVFTVSLWKYTLSDIHCICIEVQT